MSQRFWDLVNALAESPEDIDAARQLSRMFRQWLYDNCPAGRPVIDLYYNPARFEAAWVFASETPITRSLMFFEREL